MKPETIARRLHEVGGADGHGLVLDVPPSVADVRFVRIETTGPSHIGLNQVMAVGLNNDTWLHDYARTGTCRFSSQFGESNPNGAVSGNRNGDAASVTLRSDQEWWELDLGERQQLVYVALLNGCSRGNTQTSRFRVRVSPDASTWHTLVENDDSAVVVERHLNRASEQLARIEDLLKFDVAGPVYAAGAVTPAEGYRGALELLKSWATELVEIFGDVSTSNGDISFRAGVIDRAQDLAGRMRDGWDKVCTRTQDFPSTGFETLHITPNESWPDRLIAIAPPGMTFDARTGSAEQEVEFTRYGAHVGRDVSRSAYAKQRHGYHTQDTLRFNDKWWWWIGDAPEHKTETMVLFNLQVQPACGESWQLWGASHHGLDWRPVYHHGATLDIFNVLYSIAWRFEERDTRSMMLMMLSRSLQQQKRAGYLPFRTYTINQEPEPEAIEAFHDGLEAHHLNSSLRAPMLLTKHGFNVPLKNLDRVAYAKGCSLLADHLKAKFGFETAVWFGSLLGLRRSGDFIGHDDDVDMVYFGNATTYDEMLAEKVEIIDALRDDGFTVRAYGWPGKNFHVVLTVEHTEVHVDLFPSYRPSEDQVGTWHDRHGQFEEQDVANVFPLGELTSTLYPDLLGPAEVDVILEDLYGPSWETPQRNYGHRFAVQN